MIKRARHSTSLRGQRVLITGGLGFIGSNLVHQCVKAGAKVTIYDCLDPKSGGNMYNLKGVERKVKIILNDLRNFEGICAAVLNQHIVFNCAAYTSHPVSMREPLIDIEVNCKGVINLLEALRRFNPTAKLVHVGASTQTGPMVVDPITELHPEFPVDIYSANKSASEKYVMIYGKSYGLKTTVARLTNCYGPRAHITSPDFGFINYFVGLALQKKDITVYGAGNQLRNVLFVEDAAQALIQLALHKASNNHTFFVGSQEHYSVLKIAQLITKTIGGTVRQIPWPADRQAIEVGNAVIATTKIKQLIGWRPKVSLKQGLAKEARYFKAHLKQYIR